MVDFIMPSIELVLDDLEIDIVDKRGDELLALCPYHSDEHPSWSINLETGYHHCFSCHGGGTLVGLVMDQLGFSYAGARRHLLDLAESESAKIPEVKERVVRIPPGFRLPEDVVVKPTKDWIDAAREYLSERRIPFEQADRWGLGYAVGGRLEGRIVLPIRDVDGTVRSYAARSFVGDEPKYLTPERRERSDMSAMLGQQFWRGHHAVVIVEGEIDALSAERVLEGRAAVAALGGGDWQPMKVARLAHFKHVIIATDADKVGDRLAEKITQSFARERARIVRARPVGVKDIDAMNERARGHLLSWALGQ